VLHIFSQKNAASALAGAADHQRIPAGETVQPVQVDGGENVADFWLGDVKLSEYLNPLLG
jgi:hypothetical protein